MFCQQSAPCSSRGRLFGAVCSSRSLFPPPMPPRRGNGGSRGGGGGRDGGGGRGGGRRSVEITPELCEQLLSMDPNEAVAELQDQGLTQAEARDVVMQLRQEAGVSAELANTLLGLPPHEAVELLMQTPGIQEGGMTADEPVERAAVSSGATACCPGRLGRSPHALR